MEIIFKLLEYWKMQNIALHPNSLNYIQQVLESKSMFLPNDFVKYYQQVNGMGELYVNFDKEGFSFYPIEELRTLETIYKNYYDNRPIEDIGNLKNTIIFADYMHESWLYGVNIINENNYTIGIIAHYGQFKAITDSLFDFFQLYLEDAEVLYTY